MKYKKFVSAVAYVHDAECSIEHFLKTCYRVLDDNFENYEIICVNDSSTDNSKQIIRKFASTVSRGIISIVNTGFYQGVEASIQAGIDLAIGDFIFEFDDIAIDYHPNLIMQCYDRCIQGVDIVSCGTREGSRVSSQVFYSIYNYFSDTQYPLKSETFRVVSRRAINRIYSMSPNPIYRKALYKNCGLRTDYFVYKKDTYAPSPGKRNHILKNPHDTAITSLVLFTNVAYNAAFVLTIIMMLGTLGSAAYVMIVYLLGIAAPGYTTMMVLIAGSFFALFAVMTVVIKYLSLILRFAFQHQRYVVESIEKLT